MQPNNNFSVLPFYSSVEEQVFDTMAFYGDKYKLLSPAKQILPFQIIREAGSQDPIIVYLKKKKDPTYNLNISAELNATGLSADWGTEFDVIKYKGRIPLTINMPFDLYYLEVNAGTDVFYSEVFQATDVSECIRLEYWSVEDLDFDSGRISYTDDFRHVVYIKGDIGFPEYPYDEVVTSRDGLDFIEKQISEKVYKFRFYGPEYLCDALRIVRLSDKIRITKKGKVYRADNFLLTPDWMETGYLADIEVEFHCNTIIKKIAKSDIQAAAPDFNNDFNEDYSNP